jgi:acyl-CoA synthetase (AMP-forming)/AMP-acid ligase II
MRIEDRPTTIPALLGQSVEKFGDGQAVVDGDVVLTYAELGAAVHVASAALLAQGVRKGDRIGVWAPNTHRWIVVALAALSAGAVVVPLNTRYRGREAAEFLSRTGARGLFVEQGFLDYDYTGSVLVAAGDALSVEFIVDIGRTPQPAVAGHGSARCLGWDEFLAGAAGISADHVRAAIDAVQPTDLSEIIFTSGTTGRSKGVMLSHGPSLQLYRDYGRIWGLRTGDRYLVSLPFFHTGGNKAGMIVSLMYGVTIVPMATFDTVAVFDIIDRERITVMNGPPTVFTSMLDHPDRDRYNLSSLRIAATGAAVVPTVMVRRARTELPFSNFVTAYGLTECCGVASMCRPDDGPEVVAGTNGSALPGVEVKIVTAGGTALSVGETGEVLIRGQNVTRGYWDDPSATAEAIDVDGWLHTGDIGTLDAVGNVKITDRLKDLFIVGGFNVSPAEVEQVIATHPDVSEIAVIGTPDARLGEVAKAFVIPKPGRTPDTSELIAWCRENMANFKVPREIEIVESLPRNASGKVLRRELRQHEATSSAP